LQRPYVAAANSAINVECIISEVLFVLANNFDKVPKANIISLSSNFFTVDELVDAKAVLFSLTNAAHLYDVPLVQRKAGPNKRRLDMEDNYNAFASLDTNKTKIPRFVAADLKRIPPVSPSEADVCALAINVNELKSEVEALSSLRAEVSAVKDAVNGTFKSLSLQIKELCDKSATSGGLIGNVAASNGHLSSGSTDITSAVSSHSTGAAIKSLYGAALRRRIQAMTSRRLCGRKEGTLSVPE